MRTPLKVWLFSSVVFIVSSCATNHVTNTVTQSAFKKTFSHNGVSFTVVSLNDSSLSSVTIIPSGFKNDNTTISREVDGTVQDAEIADINGDGFPELYIYVQSTGSGSYGSVLAFSSNKNLSISDIYIPPLDEKSALTTGYMGHDAFAVENTMLVRRFPVYKSGDSNAHPTGGMRQLQYTLTPGEAGWVMQLTHVVMQ